MRTLTQTNPNQIQLPFQEEFKQIPSFPRYSINQEGTIIIDLITGKRKIIPPYDIKTPYRSVMLYTDSKIKGHISTRQTKNRRVHTLVAEAHIGPRPNDFVIDHIDGDRYNNHVNNLEYVTPQENALRGNNTKYLFSKNDIKEMKKLREEGTSYQEIAELYDCVYMVIYNICTGRRKQ